MSQPENRFIIQAYTKSEMHREYEVRRENIPQLVIAGNKPDRQLQGQTIHTRPGS